MNRCAARSRRRWLAGTVAALAGLAGTRSPAAGPAWPGRPATLIVPFPAGGGTDAFAQPLAAQLSRLLGQPFVVDYRSGAGGTAGAGIAARAPADGQTLFMGAVHHAIAPSVRPKLDYDIEADFVPIGLVSSVPQVIVVNAQRLPVADLKALLATLRASPGRFRCASAGSGTSHHLAGELFKLQTGCVITHVPYLGAAPALQDLIAGGVDMMFDGLASSAAHIRAGRVQALAVAADKRVAAFAQLPSVAEAGMRDFKLATWYGLWAPQGTSPQVLEPLRSALRAALNSDELAAAWRSLGSATPKLYGEAFGRFVAAEISRWAQLAQATGARLR
ncbi:MAG TPA: tripartite tricarboxylate transporter substrate-binding protein [Rubrivivax sp.]|nr:tripartite tricarboxylate transporter substrate-binding protein [Rubrivivax sp.]